MAAWASVEAGALLEPNRDESDDDEKLGTDEQPARSVTTAAAAISDSRRSPRRPLDADTPAMPSALDRNGSYPFNTRRL